MAKLKNSDNPKCWQGCEETGSLTHRWWEHKTVQPVLQTAWQLLTKEARGYHVTRNCSAVYPREVNSYIHIKICVQMSTATWFVTAPNWKQPRFHSTGKSINELRYISTVEYYSAIKRNQLLIHTTWMNLQGIMLNEKSQPEKATYNMILLI